MLTPVLVTAPTAAVVSLAEAKVHLRVDHPHEDGLISTLIEAATQHLDGWNGVLGRAIRTQTWRQDFGSFYDRLRLLVSPVATVDSVIYRSEAGAEQSVDAAHYILSDGELLIRSGYDLPNLSRDYPAPLSVTYTAGTDGPYPAPLKAAILLHVGTLYENREMSAKDWQPTLAYDALIEPWRTWA